MIVLGIETSGPTGSVALCDDDRVLADTTFPQGPRRAGARRARSGRERARAERGIMPAVDDVVRKAGIARDRIDAVAVSEGPGAFTGLRMGVTCAKTLAYALGAQAVGVPSLEVMVQNVPTDEATTACPMLDARRGKVCGTVFEWDGAAWRDTSGVLLLPPAELADAVPAGTLLFGSGVAAYPELFGPPQFRIGDEALAVGRAEAVAQVGLRRLRDGLGVDPMELVPRYHRPTEPEEKLIAARPAGGQRGDD